MRALHVPAPGEQPILGDVPEPEPGDGEVLVRVKAAGLNPFDNAIASGMLAERVSHRYPLVLGRDASGVVRQLGAGVTGFSVGDEVFGNVLFVPPIQIGTIAEFTVLPAAAVVRKPPGLDFIKAAALPLAGATAVKAVEAVGVQSGQIVLVNGASGGVGSFAVQLLARRGAIVVATGGQEDRQRLRGLGAATVVDYTRGAVVQLVRERYPEGVDAMINLAGYTADQVPTDAVRRRGRVITSTGAPDPDSLAARGVSGTALRVDATNDLFGRLTDEVSTGDVIVDVETVLSLEQAQEGLATLAAGRARGKIVVLISE